MFGVTMGRVSLVFSRVSGTLQNYSVGNSLAPWIHLIAAPEQFPSGLGLQPSHIPPRKNAKPDLGFLRVIS